MNNETELVLRFSNKHFKDQFVSWIKSLKKIPWYTDKVGWIEPRVSEDESEIEFQAYLGG